EEWSFDKANFQFHKKVKEIVIAYEKYDNQAKVIGYTAAFKIKFDEVMNIVQK
ncbi:MAG: hypothetical protein HY738_03130, partial [Bacteroidia bacterium]|nr:hypothetical protein [Bacteroidia bacterium]